MRRLHVLVAMGTMGAMLVGGTLAYGQQPDRANRETKRAKQDRQTEEQQKTRDDQTRTPRGEQTSERTSDAYAQWWAEWLQDERHEKTGASQEERIQSGAREFIRRHDRNDDGYVAENELPRNMRQGLSQLDANDDGFLSRSEIEKHAQQMRQMASSGTPVRAVFVWVLDAERNRLDLNDLQQAYELLQEIDQNNDGQISRSEMQERRQEVMVQFCNRCFQELDQNSDGELDRQETKNSVFASHFDQFDHDNDDSLTKSEIQKAIHANFDGESESARTARDPSSKGSREKSDSDQENPSPRSQPKR